MKSLYQIEQDLLDIFEQIEEADGEITPEQEMALEINENNLKEKLSNYRKAITEWEGDIEKCKLEVKRINDIIAYRIGRLLLWIV